APLRTDPDRHLELHTRMQRREPTERRRQRAAGDLLAHADSHRPGQARCRKAMTRRFLELQQPTGVAEQHFAIVGQRDAPRRAPEQWASGLELETPDVLSYRL